MIRLYAPKSYWTEKANGTLHDYIDGGCGPGGAGDWLVPDTMYGLDVQPACEIHDWMYFIGETAADKVEADRVMLNNCTRLITGKVGAWKWVTKLRLERAYKYFQAVRRFGGPAFWKGKNQDTEFRAQDYPSLIIPEKQVYPDARI